VLCRDNCWSRNSLAEIGASSADTAGDNAKASSDKRAEENDDTEFHAARSCEARNHNGPEANNVATND
jgi:hypothetical protein